MSQPPDYPGRERLKKGLSRRSTQAGGDAYQGAFEAVGAVLFACGVGYWVDGRWDTSPWGLLIGVVLGFAAMVLRLVRLGQELHPDDSQVGSDGQERAKLDGPGDEGPGVGLTPGMSDVLREDESRDERQDEDPTEDPIEDPTEGPRDGRAGVDDRFR